METTRLFQPGDRSPAICEACGEMVETVMELRDFTPPGSTEAIPGLLVAACQACGEIVAFPPQSTARLVAARRPEEQVVETIRARIPRMLEDALDAVAAQVGGGSRAARTAILRYYLRRTATSPALARDVTARAADPLARCKADASLIVKLPRSQKLDIMARAGREGIGSEADLIRGVVLLVADDFRIGLRPCDGGEPVAREAAPGADARVAFVRELAMVVS